ncbi:MAG TPA: long-chain fatty acid--CoA ligase [Gammaproteobacteria bacterium]|jgi:long-chain acyl-CoA synthetase|nr:AMP-binding protein [Gammaproteobacteria bacterium]MDP6732285.1 AMP-binding protein [Gammaproteobacteria bacterium]HAJ74933.1 long-chain fatty acid--CoA ligase [Gammaproteobacteria bacterium]
MTEPLAEELRPERFSSLTEVIDYIVVEHGSLPAFSCFGKSLTYTEVNDLSNRFAHYLQSETKLQAGDRIAIQLPNLLQFPIAFFGAVKAGLVVVNTNPLYTAHEMEHQFKDSGVKAIIILNSFCAKLESIIELTDIETVIVTQLGDLQNPIKRQFMNWGAKYVKKLVPHYSLTAPADFNTAVQSQGTHVKHPDAGRENDVALILYTGGTTGFAKGAMLSHNNLIANMMQLRARCLLIIDDQSESIAAPLPLYHSYAFLLHCLTMPFAGNHNVLITNPRDIDNVISLLKNTRLSGFVGINTLYLALLRHKDIGSIDFSEMKFCGAGGMPMTTSVAEQWIDMTGCEIIEGYGLTECSPVVSVNIPGKVKLGTVGPLVPETEMLVMDDEGQEVPAGERGELWIRGPQVMLGYWQQEQATRETINEQRWLKTGDYVQVDEEGYISIVDRKKDMILVSGFNVFPNEIEDWVNSHPGVLECAAIGVPNERTGEAIRLFVVGKDGNPEVASIITHCKAGLTAYKIPREIRFVADLPKSNIGKILRRELRE